MTGDINVIKRSGNREPLDINKLHVMVEAACEGIAGVSVSQVEMSSQIQFFDGITTEQIQQILVSSASNLIDRRPSQLSVRCCSSNALCSTQGSIW